MGVSYAQSPVGELIYVYSRAMLMHHEDVNMTEEIWVPAFKYEDKYLVSNLGRIKPINPRKNVTTLKPGWRREYQKVSMSRPGEKQVDVSVHRVVWQSFNGPIEAGLQINHKNGIKHDNRLDNLETCTASENQLHAINELGHAPPKLPVSRGERNGRAKIKQSDIPTILSLRSEGWSQQRIADKIGVHQTNVSRILMGKSGYDL